MSRKAYLCLDCKVDTGKTGEFYFIQTEIWLQVVSSKYGMLCIGCLEDRLKRKLRKGDFTDCYINNLSFGQKSVRLIGRLRAVDVNEKKIQEAATGTKS